MEETLIPLPLTSEQATTVADLIVHTSSNLYLAVENVIERKLVGDELEIAWWQVCKHGRIAQDGYTGMFLPVSLFEDDAGYEQYLEEIDSDTPVLELVELFIEEDD